MISVAEAARRLEISTSVVYRMIHTGDLAAYRKPGRVGILVDEEAVEAAKNPAPIVAVAGTTSPNRTLSVTEVAAILHCGPKTVRALIHEGSLVAQRNAGYRSHVRIPAASLDTYLTKCREAGTNPKG